MSKYFNKAKSALKKSIKSRVKKAPGRMAKYGLRALSSQVRTMAKMINAEKKFITNNTTGTLGQFNNAGVSGSRFHNLIGTNIVQGLTNSTRTGNSIKASGFVHNIEFKQQTNTVSPIRIVLEYWMTPNQSKTTGTTAITDVFDINPFNGIVDTFSERNIEQMSDYKLVARRIYHMKPDQYAGQYSTLQVKVPLKLSQHLKYDNSGSLINGHLYITMRAHLGDCGTAQTGLSYSDNTKFYFYDN